MVHWQRTNCVPRLYRGSWLRRGRSYKLARNSPVPRRILVLRDCALCSELIENQQHGSVWNALVDECVYGLDAIPAHSSTAIAAKRHTNAALDEAHILVGRFRSRLEQNASLNRLFGSSTQENGLHSSSSAQGIAQWVPLLLALRERGDAKLRCEIRKVARSHTRARALPLVGTKMWTSD